MSNQPHFDINATVVKQLGEELVSDEITALIELVKNAYDADASYANVIVDTNNVLTDESLYYVREDKKGERAKGYIIIEDDGIGMGRTEIEKGWLTFSFSYKRRMKAQGQYTPKKQRTPLGDKGLGRLSTQRLGYKLEMLTCKENLQIEKDKKQSKAKETNIYHVAFDWRNFKEDISLTAVPLFFDSIYKPNNQPGTKLLITDLREPNVWLGDAQRELVKRLSQLIFPFAEVRPFNVYLTINGVRLELETIAENLREVAVSRFFFSFDEQKKKFKVGGKIRLTRLKGLGERAELYNELVSPDSGRNFFAYLTNPENKFSLSNIEYIGQDGWFISFEETLDFATMGGVNFENGSLANPGEFHGEMDEFFLRGVNLDPLEDVFSKNADYKGFVSNHIGVRIFRDGFGIRPYGFEGYDWLKLGGGQTYGRSFYSPRPNNVIGFIALTARNNGQLKEKTDREGFVDNPYSRNFFLLMEKFVNRLDVLFNNLGRSYNEFRQRLVEQVRGPITADVSFSEMREVSSQAKVLQEQVNRLNQNLDRVSAPLISKVKEVENEPIFASTKERELYPLLNDIQTTLAEARNLVQQLKSLLPKANRLDQTVNLLEPKIKILEEQLEQFSELAGLGLTAEALSHEMNVLADRLAEQTKELGEYLKKRNIVDAKIIAHTEYVHSAVAALRKQLSHLAPSLRYVREKKDQINALKFFEEIREFYISGRFKRSNIQVVLVKPFDDFTIIINRGKLTQIIDNLILNSEYWLKEAVRRGDIKAPEITIQSKKPFISISDNGLGVDPSIELSMFQPFVTTKPKNIGRGLGLFIVRELLDSSGCSITLLPDRNEFGRRYIFQIDLTGVLDA